MRKSLSTFSLIVFAVIMFPVGQTWSKPANCQAGAMAAAKKLLEFHFGKDDRMVIDDKIKRLPSIRNPAKPKQKFQVLELWGYIYKGKYRIRLIYYPMKPKCVLMGQEILEYAKL